MMALNLMHMGTSIGLPEMSLNAVGSDDGKDGVVSE